MSFLRATIVISFVSLCFSATAQDKKDSKKWDVSNPGGPYKEVSFTTNEGTWMNVDISPDGKELVFDLLGDIYRMPAEGGTATLLRGGHAFEVQPRFSPDGKKILFTSDAGGGDNIWVMNADGSRVRGLAGTLDRDAVEPQWSSDSRTVYFLADDHGAAGALGPEDRGGERALRDVGLERDDGRERAVEVEPRAVRVGLELGRERPFLLIHNPPYAGLDPLSRASVQTAIVPWWRTTIVGSTWIAKPRRRSVAQAQ